jgi:4-hydroxybenzoate polyprenyltransferase
MAERHRRLHALASLRGWRVGVFALPAHVCFFTAIYLLLLTRGGPGVPSLLLLFLALELYFAYGVMVNDFFDREVDAAAGKSSAKRGHTLTEKEHAVALILVLAADSLVVALVGGGPVFDVLWAVAVALATLYSAPPARLRARGLPGFVVDSVIEKPLPILMVFALFGYWGFEAALFPVAGELLDSVFRHQKEDYESDLATGIVTMAVTLGRERTERVVRDVIPPLDGAAVVSLVAVTLATMAGVRAVTAFCAALMALGFLGMAVIERRGRVREGFPFNDRPLVGYLNFSFRTVFLGGLALGLLIQSPAYYLVSLVALLSVLTYLKDYYVLVPGALRRLARRNG